MNRPTLNTHGAHYRPWSVWADDDCLGRFTKEPSYTLLQSLAQDANARGWNGTILEVHKDGSWQRDFAPDCEAL